MTLTLTIDGPRWRSHLKSFAEQTPDLVPVAKGNGYGVGLGALARRTDWLGADTLAVGTYDELPQVAQRFSGDFLVLTPWRTFSTPVPESVAKRVIHTVSSPEDLAALRSGDPHARVVLERLTSMKRHGMTAEQLWSLNGERSEGVTIHLPMAGANLAEARRLVTDAVGAGATTVWVSHLTAAEMATLRQEFPDLRFRNRIGTDLWLGDRGALKVSARVLDVHPIARGEAYGYRGRTGAKGHLVIAAGGTAHGLGLVGPMAGETIRDRAKIAAKGGLESVGVVRSPFTWHGTTLRFAEPPHMQASMLLLPTGLPVPAVGDHLDVGVRYTATDFDEVVISG